MNGAAALVIEVDARRIERRLATGYLDETTDSLDQALEAVSRWTRDRVARSIGLCANAADILPALVARGVTPDVLTDQTSAHDALNGYVPNGMSLDEASRLRDRSPSDYVARSMGAMAEHVRAMLALRARGSVTFDYGNNIRAQAQKAGVENAFDFPGFVPAYIRPLFCEGKGPFRWAALSGDPADIAATDDAVLDLFPKKEGLVRWIEQARARPAERDAAAVDSESPLQVSTHGYREAGRILGSYGLPTVVVQEGGYDLAAIGGLVLAALEGIEEGLNA
jgi:urocanate hydratase